MLSCSTALLPVLLLLLPLLPVPIIIIHSSLSTSMSCTIALPSLSEATNSPASMSRHLNLLSLSLPLSLLLGTQAGVHLIKRLPSARDPLCRLCSVYIYTRACARH